MDSIPGELLVAILRYVPTLYNPCFVSKLWNKSCVKAVKHHIVAAEHEDAFSLMRIMQDGTGIAKCRAALILCEKGNVTLAYKLYPYSRPTLFSARLLKSGNVSVVTTLLLANSGHIDFSVGRVGPSSIAYEMQMKRRPVTSDLLAGLCHSNHFEEFKRVCNPYILEVKHLQFSLRSGNIEFVRFVRDLIPNAAPSSAREEESTIAYSSGNVETFQYALDFLDYRNGLRYKKALDIAQSNTRSIDMFDFLKKEGKTFGFDWLRNTIRTVSNDDFLCYAFSNLNNMSDSPSPLLEMACICGHFRLCTMIKKAHNIVCLFCGDRFHRPA